MPDQHTLHSRVEDLHMPDQHCAQELLLLRLQSRVGARKVRACRRFDHAVRLASGDGGSAGLVMGISLLHSHDIAHITAAYSEYIEHHHQAIHTGAKSPLSNLVPVFQDCISFGKLA